MIPAIGIAVVLVVILALVVPWILKAEVDTVRTAEQHILDPATPKVAYPLPNGVDVAVLAAAVAAAGHAQAVGSVDGEECLLVECHDGQREEIRSVIDRTTRERYEGSGLKLGAVVFADER
ncbi:MAG TPA: hypothetical protein VNS55_01600 [Nocardioides sp.]|nr:hypothetical protein [Nocardioides sp.]